MSCGERGSAGKQRSEGLATQYRVEPVDERRLSVSEAGALTVDSEEARSGGNDGGIAGADLIRIEADGAFK